MNTSPSPSLLTQLLSRLLSLIAAGIGWLVGILAAGIFLAWVVDTLVRIGEEWAKL